MTHLPITPNGSYRQRVRSGAVTLPVSFGRSALRIFLKGDGPAYTGSEDMANRIRSTLTSCSRVHSLSVARRALATSGPPASKYG